MIGLHVHLSTRAKTLYRKHLVVHFSVNNFKALVTELSLTSES